MAAQAPATTASVSTLNSVGVYEFKQMVNAQSFDILTNPTTNKLFAAGSNGKNYKVEQNIDITKPIVVLIDGGDVDNACFINKRSVDVKITL